MLNRKRQNLMMSVFCSKTIIVAPECWKCILRGPDFKIFPGGACLKDPLKTRAFGTHKFHLLKTVLKTLAEWSVCHFYPALLHSGSIYTLQLLVLSQAESNFVIRWTKLVKFPMGFWNRLVHLVGVVLGDFPAAVVAKANSPGIEKSRHSIMTPARLTRVSTKETPWKKKVTI